MGARSCIGGQEMLAVAEPVARTEIDALRRFTPFDRIDERAFEHLARNLSAAEYAPGATIVAAGDNASRLHVIERGSVHSEPPPLGDLSEEPYPILGPGDVFPLVALYSQSAAAGDYRAATATRCLELASQEFADSKARVDQFVTPKPTDDLPGATFAINAGECNQPGAVFDSANCQSQAAQLADIARDVIRTGVQPIEIVVNTEADTPPGAPIGQTVSLRQALEAAACNGGDASISFASALAGKTIKPLDIKDFKVLQAQ